MEYFFSQMSWLWDLPNAAIIVNFIWLTDVAGLVAAINQCFGRQLILNGIKDFVFCVASLFFFFNQLIPLFLKT